MSHFEHLVEFYLLKFCYFATEGPLWNSSKLRLDCAENQRVYVFPFFFFSRVFQTCGYCLCIVQWTVTANFDFSNFFSQSEHIVYCLRTHKFHFSTTFSLKMGPTVLFTHLKIILLQYFSVFSFNFQFSAVSKRTLSCLVNKSKKRKGMIKIIK